MWQRRTKGLLCEIIFFGYNNFLSARAARRLLPPRAPAGRALQPTKSNQNTHQRPPQAHRSSPTCHGSHQTRRGSPGGTGFCPSSELPPPPSSDAPEGFYMRNKFRIFIRQRCEHTWCEGRARYSGERAARAHAPLGSNAPAPTRLRFASPPTTTASRLERREADEHRCGCARACCPP